MLCCCPAPPRGAQSLEDRIFDALEACEAFWDSALKLLGPVFICAAVSLIGYATLTIFTQAFPKAGEVGQVTYPAVALFLCANVMFNYVGAVATDPGSAPEPGDVEEGQEERAYYRMGYTRYCRRCRRPKPPQSHHCQVCRKCVLKMDHHCPWIHNCVGFFNYRFFYLFLFYLWVYCLFVVFVLVDPLRQEDPWNFSQFMRRYRYREGPLFCAVLATSVFIAISLLLGFHTYLVLTAQSTIDFYRNLAERRVAAKAGEKWVNPWDVGYVRNWQEVFDTAGPLWWLAWALPRWRRKAGDGIVFPSAYGYGYAQPPAG